MHYDNRGMTEADANQIRDAATGNCSELPAAYGYEKSNREKSRTAKRTKFWCAGCDAQLVSTRGKCPRCGHRENRKKIFKS